MSQSERIARLPALDLTDEERDALFWQAVDAIGAARVQKPFQDGSLLRRQAPHE